ncbi:MAG: alpha/beta hydrolase [Chloroflexia bacterium]
MPYVDNEGVRLYYEVEGDGPPLVLHVGGFQRLQDWRREEVAVAQALRGEYRLILLDPRGQGRATSRTTRRPTLSTRASAT